MKKQYRYILSGTADLDDPISDYRLVPGNGIRGGHMTAIRVDIPDDMRLYNCRGDGYAITYDARTLRSLNPKAMVCRNGRWVFMQQLLDHPVKDWPGLLYENLGLRPVLHRGYLNKKQFAKHAEDAAAKAPKDFASARDVALCKITDIVKAIDEQDARHITGLCESMLFTDDADNIISELDDLRDKYPNLDPDALCDAMTAFRDVKLFLC